MFFLASAIAVEGGGLAGEAEDFCCVRGRGNSRRTVAWRTAAVSGQEPLSLAVGNVFGTCVGLMWRNVAPSAELFPVLSRIALPVGRSNATFYFFNFYFSPQRFEKLCRCILNSMDVENEPKVSGTGCVFGGRRVVGVF